MNLKFSISPKKTVITLIGIVTFLTLSSIAVQIGKYVYNYRKDWTRLFNLDRELNFPSFYSTLTLLFCALLLKLIADTKKNNQEKYSQQWKILSIIFVYLAIDEFFSIHEILIIPDLADKLNLPGFLHQVWVIPASILVIFFIWKYWKFTFNLPRSTRLYFMFAASLYIGGALIMEMVGGSYAEADHRMSLGYALIANLEEVMEMLGVIVFIYALLKYLRKYQQTLNININIEFF